MHPLTETTTTFRSDTDRYRWSEPMSASIWLRLEQAQRYRRDDLAAAANARLIRAIRADRSTAIRARIGRSIIRLGERLAAEPDLVPARPR
jgi:hypothetical protein